MFYRTPDAYKNILLLKKKRITSEESPLNLSVEKLSYTITTS